MVLAKMRAHVVGQSGYEVASVKTLAKNFVEEKHAGCHLLCQKVVGQTEVILRGEDIEAGADLVVGKFACGK